MAVDFEKMLYYWLFLYLCDDDDEDEKEHEWFPSSREGHLVLYFSVGSFRLDLDLVFFCPLDLKRNPLNRFASFWVSPFLSSQILNVI